MLKRKSAITILMSLILAILPMLSLVYMQEVKYIDRIELTKDYEISVVDNKKEVRILNIYVDNTPIDLGEMQLSKGASFEDGHLLISGWLSENPIILKKARAQSLKIEFLKHPWSGVVQVRNRDDTVTMDLYAASDNIWTYEAPAIIPDFLKTIGQAFGHGGYIYLSSFVSYLIFAIIITLCLRGILSFFEAQTSINLTRVAKFTCSVFIILLLTLYTLIELISIYGIMIILILVISACIKMLKTKNLALLFVIMAVTTGCIMILLIPPTHILDEYRHFIKSYVTSFWGADCNIASSILHPEDGDTFIYLPKSIQFLKNKYESNVTNSEFTVPVREYLIEYSVMLEQNSISEELVWFGNTIQQPILGYIPSAIVITVLRYLNLSPLLMFHLGRFASFLCWVLISYKAISITTKFKFIFFLVMLMPISLQQSFGFNIDWNTNAMAFLLLALLIKEIFPKSDTDQKLTWKKAMVISLVGILLALGKSGYFPIIFLSVLIPSKRYDSRKQQIKMLAFMIIPTLLTFALSYLYITFFQIAQAQRLDRYGMSYVLAHPLNSIAIGINTLINQGDQLLLRGLLVGFGWYTKYAPAAICFLVWSIYLVLLIVNPDETATTLSWKQKCVFFAVFAIMCAGIFVAMLTSWTPKGYDQIDGLQPRYFIPCMIPLWLVIQNKSIRLCTKEPISVFVSGVCFVLCLSIITIFTGFYM